MDVEAPSLDDNLVKLFIQLSGALAAGGVSLSSAGFLIMTLVALLRRFPLVQAHIQPKWVPIYVLLLSMAEAFAHALSTSASLSEAAGRGLISAVVAVGSWEMAGKPVLRPLLDAVCAHVARIVTYAKEKWKSWRS
jgi:hypothetical protein